MGNRFLIEPLTTRSGGNIAEFERDLEMQGFSIKDGVVRAPELQVSQKTKTDYWDAYNRVTPALTSMVRTIGAADLANKEASWKSEYQKFQINDREGARKTALKDGNFSRVYDDASGAYDKFVTTFTKKNPGSRTMLRKEIEAGKQETIAWSLEQQTRGASEYAVENIQAIAAIAGNTIRLDPSSVYEQVRQIEMQESTFAVVLNSAAKGKEYMQELRSSLIMGAIQETGLRSADQAQAIYANYKKADDQRAKENLTPILTPEQHLRVQKMLTQLTADHLATDLETEKDKNAVQYVSQILNGETHVANPRDPAVHDAVDRVMANYDTDLVQQDPQMRRATREDIIIRTGYIPKAYEAVISDQLRYGKSKARGEAATSIMRIANEGLSTGDQVEKSLLADAFKLSMLIQGVGIDEAINIFDTQKREPKIAKEIMQKEATDWFNEDKRDNKDVVSKISNKVFSAGFFGSSEKLPHDYKARFETQARDLLSFNYIDCNMNKPAAQAAVGGTLMKTWGNAKVLDAPDYQAYRPIQVFLNERKVTKEEFESQLKSAYASLTMPEGQKLPQTKNLRIHHAYNKKDTGAPVYQVYKTSKVKDGTMLQPIMIQITDKRGNTKIVPWYIDTDKFKGA